MQNKENIGHQKTKVSGVGINDCYFKVGEIIEGKGRLHPAYSIWAAIMRRCYSKNSNKLYRTYIDCVVCDDWKLFSNFNKWYKENYKEGYHLDKDILFIGNRVYSPTTCIFVPRWINAFVTASNKTRGKYKIGVHFNKQASKFEARCNLGDKRVYLGIFDNEEAAHNAWLEYKLKLLKNNKETIENIDQRLYSALINKVLNLK